MHPTNDQPQLQLKILLNPAQNQYKNSKIRTPNQNDNNPPHYTISNNNNIPTKMS